MTDAARRLVITFLDGALNCQWLLLPKPTVRWWERVKISSVYSWTNPQQYCCSLLKKHILIWHAPFLKKTPMKLWMISWFPSGTRGIQLKQSYSNSPWNQIWSGKCVVWQKQPLPQDQGCDGKHKIRGDVANKARFQPKTPQSKHDRVHKLAKYMEKSAKKIFFGYQIAENIPHKWYNHKAIIMLKHTEI